MIVTTDATVNATQATVNVCLHDSSQTKLGSLDPAFMTYYYGIFFLFTVINIVGNSIVLTTFYRHKDLRTPGNSFICSLAVSDLLVGLVYPFYNVAHIETPEIKGSLGQWSVCMMLITEATSLQSCSSYGLVAIAVSRLLIIMYPLRYCVFLTKRNSKEYCNICRYELIFPARVMTFLTLFQFAIPLLIMITANVWMAYTAQTMSKRISLSFATDGGGQARGISALWHGQKAFVVVTLLVGCFTISWTPMIIYCFVIIVGKVDVAEQEYFSATARISLYFNYAINVFIYAGRMTDFREHVHHDLCHVICRRSRVAPSGVSGGITHPRTGRAMKEGAADRHRRHRGSRLPSETTQCQKGNDTSHSDDTVHSEGKANGTGTCGDLGAFKRESSVRGNGTVTDGGDELRRDINVHGQDAFLGRIHREGTGRSGDRALKNVTVCNDSATHSDNTVQRDSTLCTNSVMHKDGVFHISDITVPEDGILKTESAFHKGESAHDFGCTPHRCTCSFHGDATFNTDDVAHRHAVFLTDDVAHRHSVFLTYDAARSDGVLLRGASLHRCGVVQGDDSLHSDGTKTLHSDGTKTFHIDGTKTSHCDGTKTLHSDGTNTFRGDGTKTFQGDGAKTFLTDDAFHRNVAVRREGTFRGRDTRRGDNTTVAAVNRDGTFYRDATVRKGRRGHRDGTVYVMRGGVVHRNGCVHSDGSVSRLVHRNNLAVRDDAFTGISLDYRNGVDFPRVSIGHRNGVDFPRVSIGHRNGVDFPRVSIGHRNGVDFPRVSIGHRNGVDFPRMSIGHRNGVDFPGVSIGHRNGVDFLRVSIGHRNGVYRHASPAQSG
ncbi:hypothetical protein BaRGS_00015706 [Batillaria attramentaria]|uniref:G-protein coupled receptors family 1 profile domain-containing protein n=1 Tax=Batillaria attramentaria TaxID=370345 RepID=A0ABD0L0U6_9CAEN